jgi:glycosyltransferase involved in cell wall biosynthesis
VSRSDAPVIPLVSVIIPTHDRPHLLARALESVAAQTHPAVEVLVVDDGSTPRVPTDLTAGRHTVRVLRHETARGPGAARNTGIGAATGELIAFLDDDDRWPPERLAVAVADLARSGGRLHAMAASRRSRAFTGDMRRSLERGVMPLVGQVVMHRDDVIPFDEELRVSEDTDWWLRLRDRAVFTWSDEVGLVIGAHASDRPGADPDVRFRCRRIVAERHLASLTRAGRAAQCNRVAASALLAGRRRAARGWAWRGLRTWPTLLGVKLLAGAGLGPATARRWPAADDEDL